MNKKSFMIDIISWILIFSFVSIFYITIAILNFALWNDYVIYNMQNITEDLEIVGTIKAGTANFTQTAADQFRTTNFHFDDIWFLGYFIFVFTSLVASYRAKQQNYFSFLSFLFYGIMFVLFLLTIFSTLTTWWQTEILEKMLPDTAINLPKFYFYVENIGIFSTIHLALCLIVNLFDFKLAFMKAAKKQEEISFDDEVI